MYSPVAPSLMQLNSTKHYHDSSAPTSVTKRAVANAASMIYSKQKLLRSQRNANEVNSSYQLLDKQTTPASIYNKEESLAMLKSMQQDSGIGARASNTRLSTSRQTLAKALGIEEVRVPKLNHNRKVIKVARTTTQHDESSRECRRNNQVYNSHNMLEVFRHAKEDIQKRFDVQKRQQMLEFIRERTKVISSHNPSTPKDVSTSSMTITSRATNALQNQLISQKI